MVFNPTQQQQDLAQLVQQFGIAIPVPSYGGAQDTFWENVNLGTILQARLNAVGGAETMEELLEKENPKTVPESATIGFDNVTENSVMVFWNPHSDGGSPITGYHLVIKNENTGQTITESNTSPNVTNTLLQNLDSGTNYKAYVIVINAIGNSFEQSNGFKTLGVIPVVEPPIVIPPTYDFIIEPDGKVRMFRIGAVEYTEIKVFPDSVQSYIDRGVSRLLTAQERAIPYPRPIVVPPVVEPPVVVPPVIIPPVVDVPVIDTSINSNMVSQSIGAFKLENGRVQGDIIYIAESAFNSYYYNKSITSIIQIKDQEGFTIKTKTNNLNFTATERDERISIDENIGNDINAIKIDFFVWESIQSPTAFSIKKTDEIVAKEVGLSACPIGQHRDFNNKCVPNDPIIGSSLLGKVMGVTALIGTLALLGSKGR